MDGWMDGYKCHVMQCNAKTEEGKKGGGRWWLGGKLGKEDKKN